MTWRELFAWRPRWWMDLAARFRQMTDSEPAEPRHPRSSEERAHFWAEFRSGQREADLRAAERVELEERKILTPCSENGPK